MEKPRKNMEFQCIWLIFVSRCDDNATSKMEPEFFVSSGRARTLDSAPPSTFNKRTLIIFIIYPYIFKQWCMFIYCLDVSYFAICINNICYAPVRSSRCALVKNKICNDRYYLIPVFKHHISCMIYGNLLVECNMCCYYVPTVFFRFIYWFYSQNCLRQSFRCISIAIFCLLPVCNWFQ